MKNIEIKSSLHISIPSELLKQFNNYSELLGKSRNQIIASLLEEWIEDQNDILLAEQVMNEIKSGKKRTISWGEMKELIRE